MKRKTTNKIHTSINELKTKINEIVKELITNDFIKTFADLIIFLT